MEYLVSKVFLLFAPGHPNATYHEGLMSSLVIDQSTMRKKKRDYLRIRTRRRTRAARQDSILFKGIFPAKIITSNESAATLLEGIKRKVT